MCFSYYKTGKAFALMHVMPGFITRELTPLFLPFQQNKAMVAFLGNTKGNIEKLYSNTNNLEELKPYAIGKHANLKANGQNIQLEDHLENAIEQDLIINNYTIKLLT